MRKSISTIVSDMYLVDFYERRNNTSFKNFDPTHPCRKCWERYSRPYVGTIAYTAWSNNSTSRSSSTSRVRSGSAGSNTNFQRPLPAFRPPQHILRTSTSQTTHHRSASSPNLSLPRVQSQCRQSAFTPIPAHPSPRPARWRPQSRARRCRH